MPDESIRLTESTAFKDHFSALAEVYAAYRPHYPPALFDWLASIAPGRRLAWDCACGSGQATTALADRFESVLGTDASEQQIAAAATHAGIAFRVAPAERSGLEDASADLVTVAQALHWFDLQPFYDEVQRVLRANGVIAAWAYGVNRIDDREADRLVQQFYSETLGPWWPAERRLVESGYRTMPFPFRELTPPSFVMQERWSLDQLLGYFSSWSAVARYRAHHGQDPVADLRSRLEPIWGDPRALRAVTWPVAMRVGTIS